MNKITIKFIADFSPYMKGDVATFLAPQAERIIARGAAIKFNAIRTEDAERLKHLANPPRTAHIPGPENTRHIPGPQKTKTAERKCGNCGKPGHTKNNCPTK